MDWFFMSHKNGVIIFMTNYYASLFLVSNKYMIAILSLLTEKVQSDFRFKLAKTQWQFRQLFLKFDMKYKVSKKYFWTK